MSRLRPRLSRPRQRPDQGGERLRPRQRRCRGENRRRRSGRSRCDPAQEVERGTEERERACVRACVIVRARESGRVPERESPQRSHTRPGQGKVEGVPIWREEAPRWRARSHPIAVTRGRAKVPDVSAVPCLRRRRARSPGLQRRALARHGSSTHRAWWRAPLATRRSRCAEAAGRTTPPATRPPMLACHALRSRW